MDYQFLLQQYRTANSTPKRSQQRLLYQCLREAILHGQLRPGETLPGSRSLATELNLSRNTVLYAYEQLMTEGLLVSSGRSTRIAPQFLATAQVAAPVNPAEPRQLSPRAQPAPWPSDSFGNCTAFVPGVPALAHFPIRIWRRCVDRAWRDLNYRQLDYASAAGEPALRTAIAEHLVNTRGVVCSAEHILITNGTQESLSICARALANAGDTAWIENPGYGGAFQALRAAELKVRGIHVDAEGIAPTPEDWQKHPPKIIYTTPSHQFPLGSVMSVERRLALLGLANRHGALIIEDDYDSEFRRDGPPLPAMQGLINDAPVIYLGTFSKTLFPGLRMSYMVVPQDLIEPLKNILGLAYLRGRSADQLALAEFLRAGHFASHLKKMRRLYAIRRDALVAAITTHLHHVATIYGGSSGIHLTLALPPSLNDGRVSDAALASGVYTQALSRLATGPGLRNGLMLGYAQLNENEIEKAIVTLADVIRRQSQ